MGAEENIKPESAEAWCDRASHLVALGKFQDAARCFRKALKLRPDDGTTWTSLGLALLQSGKYQGALKSFDKALKQPRFLTNNWVFRAEALVRLGRYQEAVESYEVAIQSGLDDEARSGWMEALNRLEKYLRKRVPKPRLEAYDLVASIEEELHLFVRRRLQEAFGQEEGQWWGHGVPLSVRQKCAQRREEDPKRRPLYNYTDLIDLKEVIDKSFKYFETDFERVKGKVMGKKGFLDSLVRLNELRKTVMHPIRSPIDEDDLQFGRQMRNMIESFAPLE